MAAVVMYSGDIATLYALGGADGSGFIVRLFQNDFTPVAGSTLVSFVEGTYSGYAAYAGPGWSAPVTATTGVAWTQAPALLFTQTGTGVVNTIYGWYITVVSGGVERVLCADRFPVPRVMNVAGAQCPVQPMVTCQAAA